MKQRNRNPHRTSIQVAASSTKITSIQVTAISTNIQEGSCLNHSLNIIIFVLRRIIGHFILTCNYTLNVSIPITPL